MDEPQEAKPRFSTEYTKPQKRFTIPRPSPTFWIALAVIGVLVLLMWPACRVAREKARRARCMGNLKQIGLAMRLYSADNKGRYPTEAQATALGSWALLTNSYQISHCLWVCPTDAHIAGCSVISRGMAPNPFSTRIVSYSYGAFGLTEQTQPDTPLACDRTSGDVRSLTPYINNQWTHKSDGGNVLFVDGHVVWQSKFVPSMYNGRNP